MQAPWFPEQLAASSIPPAPDPLFQAGRPHATNRRRTGSLPDEAGSPGGGSRDL